MCPGGTAFAAGLDDPLFGKRGSWGQAYDDQWAVKRVGFTDEPDSAWSKETGTTNRIIVAVIDTGIDYFHPDLARDTVWRNPAEKENGIDDDKNGYVDDLIGWNFVDGNNNPWDQAGHGTHVAGVIAANTNNGVGIAGINRGARIMPLKVLNLLGRGRSSGIAEAIHYAVKHGARVINLSLGGAEISASEQRAIDHAFANNVLVIVAAGNEGVETANYGPASSENVLTVGASGPDDEHLGFSNWGASVDLVAPGIDVLSLRARATDFALIADAEGYSAGDGFVGGDARYYRASGTSFAAPLVTGVASLLLARDPGLTAADLMRILRQSARDISVPGIDQFTGYGLLDARSALTLSPEFFLEVAIAGVELVQQGGKPALKIIGTLDADQLDEAWIEIGKGEDPDKWQKVSRTIKKKIENGGLDELAVKHFAGEKLWTLRLIGKHKNGKQREARYVLELG
jgi:subtilisin family serine protease